MRRSAPQGAKLSALAVDPQFSRDAAQVLASLQLQPGLYFPMRDALDQARSYDDLPEWAKKIWLRASGGKAWTPDEERLHPRGHGGRFARKFDKVSDLFRDVLPQAHIVGGAVRDTLLGRDPKDEDFVVPGMGPKEIRDALRPHGRSEDLVVNGRNVGLRFYPDYEGAPPEGVEVVPPRKEVSTGPSRHDFDIVAAPDIPLEEDAKRRDFTINALYQPVSTTTGEKLYRVDDVDAGVFDNGFHAGAEYWKNREQALNWARDRQAITGIEHDVWQIDRPPSAQDTEDPRGTVIVPEAVPVPKLHLLLNGETGQIQEPKEAAPPKQPDLSRLGKFERQIYEQMQFGEVRGANTTTRVFLAYADIGSGQRFDIGALTVDEKSGTVELVKVAEEFRRLGIATNLLQVARQATGLPLRMDTGERSPSGQAWAEAQGIGRGTQASDLSAREAEAMGARLFVGIMGAQDVTPLPDPRTQTETPEIVDPTGHGLDDLKNKLLRTTSAESFRDDPLRMMRAVRFVSQLGFKLSPDTEQQMREHADAIEHVSGERIQAELDKTLMGRYPRKALQMAIATGLLQHVIPEFGAVVGYGGESRYHSNTVDQHILAAVQRAADDDAPLEVRLALLFHDLGKPEAAYRNARGKLKFNGRAEGEQSQASPGHDMPGLAEPGAAVPRELDPNRPGPRRDHQDIGADIARRVMRRLRYPTKVQQWVESLVRGHMADARIPATPLRARQFMAEHRDHAIDILTHRRADLQGKEPVPEGIQGEVENLRKLEALIHDQQHMPTRLSDLAVDGRDLIEVGFQPGPMLGQALHELLRLVLAHPERNTKEELLTVARRMRPRFTDVPGAGHAKDEKSIKALVQVDPYVREGEQVSGYVRHGNVSVSSAVVKTSGEAAKLRADLTVESWLRKLEQSHHDVEALPVRRLDRDTHEWKINGVPARDYRGPSATWYGAGIAIDKYDYGDGTIKYGIGGGDQPHESVVEAEWREAARQRVLNAHAILEKNWRKNYRGKIAPRSGRYLESHKRLNAAVAANDANPRYRKVREWAQIADYVIPVGEAAYGTPAFQDKDVLTTAFRDVDGMPMTHLNMLAVEVRVRWKPGDVLYREPKPLTPGQEHATQGRDPEAGLLRHEWAHSLFIRLTDKQRAQFASFVPDDVERVKAELSSYAASHLEPEDGKDTGAGYREIWGPHGHYTETFSEAVAAVTDPDFKRDEWAPWLGEIADWLDRLTQEPLR